MKKQTFIIVLGLMLISMVMPLTGNAQTLSEDEKEQLRERILDKLEDFQCFLSTMADKNNSATVRQDALESNLNLFIGKCEPYSTYDIWTDREEQMPAVFMETSSVNRTQKSRQKMKNYFTKLMNNKAYANIQIEQSDAVRVGEIQPVGNGKYVAIAYICQKFVGYSENGGVRYGDVTEKKVKIHIDHSSVRTAHGVEDIWDVKLGNMYVVSTQRLR